jgi:SAM-dependent methyltransferase
MKNTNVSLDLPPSAGSLDTLILENAKIQAHGWMRDPHVNIDRIDIFLDGKYAGPVSVSSRSDVAAAYSWAKIGLPLSFDLTLSVDDRSANRLDLISFALDGPIAKLSSFFPNETERQLPLAPDKLAQRVSGMSGLPFRTQGLRMFTDLADQIARISLPKSARILDWGSGCGRVTQHMIARLADAEVLGCDIDDEAVRWCNQNLGRRFHCVSPSPPTIFEGGSFDLVTACSVLTHLTAADQGRRIAEVARILKPGGYFMASTHGENAYKHVYRGHRSGRAKSSGTQVTNGESSALLLQGIEDSQPDATLDGIAPDGYYRATFQSREYTISTCSKHFELVDYLERGLNGYQDLVILRRIQ